MNRLTCCDGARLRLWGNLKFESGSLFVAMGLRFKLADCESDFNLIKFIRLRFFRIAYCKIRVTIQVNLRLP